ncbi:hypothetical protein [Clostridium baratii]|uniref:hypothetical protein n=1 Tax=Clostridium baratii TaxID=1561 RepID=UPI003D32D7CA
MKKLILFNKDASKNDLINNINPIAVIDDITTSAIIEYSLDSNHIITVHIDSELGKDIINEINDKVIIKVKALDNNYEYFLVSGDSNELNDSLKLVGRHLTMEWMNSMFIKDSKPRNLNAGNMLMHLKEESEEYKQGKQFARDIELSSSIDKLVSTNIWHSNFNNTLIDLQELYSSEVRRKGFMVSLVDKVGRVDKPVYQIKYAENLISNTISREFDAVYGILPKGYDKLYGNIVYSTKLTSGITEEREYKVRVREEDKEDEEGYTYFDTEEEAMRELERLARQDFDNGADDYVITFDTKFIDLATVEESNVSEKTYLEVGDLVLIDIPKSNLSVNSRVQSFNYNVLSEEIEDVTLSNNTVDSLKVPTINSISKEIENLPNKEELVSTARQEISDFINSGFGGIVQIYPDRIEIIDSKTNTTKKLMLNMNGIGGSTDGGKTYNTAMTIDGRIIANAIKLGVLESLNKKSWINMETGAFNFANNLIMDENGKINFTGTINNERDGVGIGISLDGVELSQRNRLGNKEIVGGVKTGWFTSNRDINGINICNTSIGDYIAFSGINQQNFEGIYDYNNIVIITTKPSPFFNNFVGMDVRKNFNVIGTSTFCDLIEVATSSSVKNNHQIYNSKTGTLCVLGDNGLELGYRKGTENMNRIKICESPISNNCTILTWGNIDMNGGVIKNGSIANTYANTVTRTATELTTIQSEDNEVRYIYENVQLNNAKAILNIPKKYSGINNGYAISSIVKKGQGDVWISEEFEDRFILNSDKDIKVNVEIVIKLNNSILIKEGSDTYNGAKSSKCS